MPCVPQLALPKMVRFLTARLGRYAHSFMSGLPGLASTWSARLGKLLSSMADFRWASQALGCQAGNGTPTGPQQPGRRTVTPLHYHFSPGLTRPLGARPGKICPHIHEYQAGELHPLFHGLLPLGWPDPGVPYWEICPNFQGWPPRGGPVTKVPGQGSCNPSSMAGQPGFRVPSHGSYASS